MNNYQLPIERYQVYKDSGFEWLGEVPEHWEEKRVKDIAILERGKFTHRPRNDPQMYDGIHPFIQTGDVARAIKYVTTYKQTLSDKGTQVSKWFPKGTLVMAIAANIGDVAIVDFDTYFPDSIVAYKSQKNDTDYLFYLFSATRHELDKVKVTNTQDNLNLERLNSLIKFLPPLPEQKTIANYLDTKTAQIDRKIDLLTQKATLYSNLKQSLINETVTRGLDKSVPRKDSGIEWLGEIPEHWEIQRIKDVGSIKYGLSQPPKYIEKGLPLIRATNVEKGKVVETGLVFINPDDVPHERNPILNENDIVVVRSGAYTADSAIIPKKYHGAIAGFDMVLRPHKIQPKYLSYILLSNYVLNDQLILSSFRAAQPHLNKEELGIALITYPPLPEQKAIANYLDTKTAQIDQIIQTINTQIEKLKEFRKTLINDVVTGKIKV